MRRAFFALAERDWAGRVTYRFAWLVEFGGAAIFLAALYYVGRLVPPQMIAGRDYFTVTAIGVGLYAFTGTVAAAPRSFIMSEIGFGTIETLLTLGPSVMRLMAASTLLAVVKALSRILLVLVVAAVLGCDLHLSRLPLLLPILILGAAAGAGMGSLQAAVDLRVRRVGRVVALAGGASALLSGVYFPVGLLPSSLQVIAEFLPATHAVSAARAVLFGAALPLKSMVILSVMAVFYLSAGAFAFRIADRGMREDGSFLTH